MMRWILCAFLFLFSAPVMAQGLALPDIQSLPIETFVSQSDKIEKEIEDDPYIKFDVQLPKTFVERDYDVLKHYERNGRVYGEVYRKDGVVVQDVRPYFSVRTTEISRPISAKNWFVVNLLAKGHTLRGIQSDVKGDEFEALYVRFDELDNTEIVRVKGYLRGARIITAEYVLPTLLWNEQRDMQTYAIKSFELKGVFDNQQVEPLMSYTHLESFSMKYPQSWRLESDQKDLENQIDLFFRTADDLRVVFADIHLTLVADQSLKDPIDRSRYPTNLPQIIKARKDGVIESGFMIGDVMERRTYDLAFKPLMQVTEIYPLRKKLTDYVSHRQAPVSRELWITVIKGTKDDGKNYVLTMTAPSRTGASVQNWSLAAKAYEIMVESIR